MGVAKCQRRNTGLRLGFAGAARRGNRGHAPTDSRLPENGLGGRTHHRHRGARGPRHRQFATGRTLFRTAGDAGALPDRRLRRDPESRRLGARAADAGFLPDARHAAEVRGLARRALQFAPAGAGGAGGPGRTGRAGACLPGDQPRASERLEQRLRRGTGDRRRASIGDPIRRRAAPRPIAPCDDDGRGHGRQRRRRRGYSPARTRAARPADAAGRRRGAGWPRPAVALAARAVPVLRRRFRRGLGLRHEVGAGRLARGPRLGFSPCRSAPGGRGSRVR